MTQDLIGWVSYGFPVRINRPLAGPKMINIDFYWFILKGKDLLSANLQTTNPEDLDFQNSSSKGFIVVATTVSYVRHSETRVWFKHSNHTNLAKPASCSQPNFTSDMRCLGTYHISMEIIGQDSRMGKNTIHFRFMPFKTSPTGSPRRHGNFASTSRCPGLEEICKMDPY